MCAGVSLFYQRANNPLAMLKNLLNMPISNWVRTKGLLTPVLLAKMHLYSCVEVVRPVFCASHWHYRARPLVVATPSGTKAICLNVGSKLSRHKGRLKLLIKSSQFTLLSATVTKWCLVPILEFMHFKCEIQMFHWLWIQASRYSSIKQPTPVLVVWFSDRWLTCVTDLHYTCAFERTQSVFSRWMK